MNKTDQESNVNWASIKKWENANVAMATLINITPARATLGVSLPVNKYSAKTL